MRVHIAGSSGIGEEEAPQKYKSWPDVNYAMVMMLYAHIQNEQLIYITVRIRYKHGECTMVNTLVTYIEKVEYRYFPYDGKLC